jgi:hypothetical protein
MRRLGSASLVIIGSILAGAPQAQAQQVITVQGDVVFYGDNTEFRNPFREGETIFGTAARGEARFDLNDRVAVAAGAFGNLRFGSESAFDLVRPVFTLSVSGRRSRFLFGTLDVPRVGRPAGPDRTGPHGLLPPIQRETLAFDRPYEAGLQWLFKGHRLDHDMWLQWQRLNTPEHRERLDAGVRLDWRWHRVFSLPLQTHIVHEGGQLFAAGPVRDSFVLASGITLGPGVRSRISTAAPPGRRRFENRDPTPDLENSDLTPGMRGSLELLGLWSHYNPDRQQPTRTRDGAGFFGRAAVEGFAWRGHLIMWRGDDYMKDEGDGNYQSLRRDGTRYRGVRDYAEIGATRTFALAPGALVEVSFRYHRIERHYEYSYRVLGVAHLSARVK